MTESNFEHINSICLCGMKKCRGYYLQLANSKAYAILDRNNCFHFRNSLILLSIDMITEEEKQLCFKHNYKKAVLDDLPGWMVKWIYLVLKYI